MKFHNSTVIHFYRIKLSKDQNHGKAFGRLVWRGRMKTKDERIGAPLKPQWKLLGTPDYKKFKLTELFKDQPADKIPPSNNEEAVESNQ